MRVAPGTAAGNIYLYGAPGVECELKLVNPPGLRITFLQFAAAAFKLLAIGTDTFYVVIDFAH